MESGRARTSPFSNFCMKPRFCVSSNDPYLSKNEVHFKQIRKSPLPSTAFIKDQDIDNALNLSGLMGIQ